MIECNHIALTCDDDEEFIFDGDILVNIFLDNALKITVREKDKHTISCEHTFIFSIKQIKKFTFEKAVEIKDDDGENIGGII